MKYRFIGLVVLIIFFADLYSQDYKIFKSDGSEGVIRYDDTIIKAEYDDVIYLGGCDLSYFAIKKNGKYAIWNYDSEKPNFQLDFVYPISDYFGKKYSFESSIVVVDNKVGLIDISTCQFGIDFSIKANYQTFYLNDSFYKEKGFYILKAEINDDSSDFFIIYQDFQDIIKLSHLKGVKEIYPVKSASLYDEFVFIFEKNSKFGIANQSEIVLEPKFDNVELLPFEDIAFFEIIENGKKNVFSYVSKKIIFPKFYSKIINFYYGGLLLSSVYENDKSYIFMDEFPMDTIEPVSTFFLNNLYFDDFELIDNQYAFVKLDDKWAMVNEFEFLTDFSFKKPIKCKFRIENAKEKWKKKSEKQLNSGDSPFYKVNGKFGLIEPYFSPAIFDTIFEYNNSLIIKYNNVYGLYIDGNLHKFNIHKFEFNEDKSNPLIKAFYKNRFKYINSIENPYFNNVFYDSISIINYDNYLGFYNGKLGGYSPSNYNEIPPIFDSILFPWNDAKMKIAFYKSFILPIYEYDYTSNPIVFKDFKKDTDLKDFIYLKDSSYWTFKYKTYNFYLKSYESVEEINAKYVKPIVNWNEEKKQAGFEFEKLDQNLLLLKNENKSEVYYFSYSDFFRNIDNYRYLIYSGNADSVVIKASYILAYNNGLFKPFVIDYENKFNNQKLYFKTFKTNGLISYLIDSDQKKHFFFKDDFYEFDKLELLENGFTIFEKDFKYAVLDDTQTYFSGFEFDDVIFDSSIITQFAFKKNGKWGLMSSIFNYETARKNFKVKHKAVYKTSKEVFKL